MRRPSAEARTKKGGHCPPFKTTSIRADRYSAGGTSAPSVVKSGPPSVPPSSSTEVAAAVNLAVHRRLARFGQRALIVVESDRLADRVGQEGRQTTRLDGISLLALVATPLAPKFVAFGPLLISFLIVPVLARILARILALIIALEVLARPPIALEPIAALTTILPFAALLPVTTLLPVATVEAGLTVGIRTHFVGLRLVAGIGLFAKGAVALEAALLVTLLVEGPLLIAVLFAQLFLSRGDDPVIVLGVLEIVLCSHRISACLRVAGKLAVFLGDMLSCAADLYVRSVRLVAPCQGIGTLVVAVATAHTPILSWSHVWSTTLAGSSAHAMQANFRRTGISPPFAWRPSVVQPRLMHRVVLQFRVQK
jgi:hypothetical protein